MQCDLVKSQAIWQNRHLLQGHSCWLPHLVRTMLDPSIPEADAIKATAVIDLLLAFDTPPRLSCDVLRCNA